MSDPFERLVQELGRLPGLGRRSAERMALALVGRGESAITPLAEALVAARGGWYVDEYLAFEAEALCAPHAASDVGGTAVWGGSVQALWHLSGWEAFDKLFGCERFAPFLTCGAQALCAPRHVFADGSHRTGIGPAVGFGAFYHLTDNWSLRAEARAALAVDSPCGMTYALLAGLQYSFGD